MSFPRRRQPEWMDDPGLDPAQHRQALSGLRRINRWTRSGAAIWTAIKRMVRLHGLSEISILDLATGSGDVALRVANSAKQYGLQVHVTGCDCSRLAVEEASERAQTLGVSQVEFVQLNVLEDVLPVGFDVVMCSLFLHHLDEPDAIALFRRMRQAATRMVLVDDLRRTSTGYWLAWIGSRLLSRSPVVHQDGPLSVAGAFTPIEAVCMAEAAGLLNAAVETHWPQRYLLSWNSPC